MSNRLVHRWYSAKKAPRWLRPVAYLYGWLANRRRNAYITGRKKQFHAPVPVLVIGNLSVGGTGKTPLTITLIEKLREAGFRPGIVSRGYGAKPPFIPYHVLPDTNPEEGGDEPVMLAQRTQAPVVIDPKRPAAVAALLSQYDCDLVISDDGLQHYPLGRDLEVLVYDASRGLGNGWCLPAGPLREPVERGESVDFVIRNGETKGGKCLYPSKIAEEFEMQLAPSAMIELHTRRRVEIDDWHEKSVYAIAGIGNPERFFKTLEGLGLKLNKQSFEDHQTYTPEMFNDMQDKPILMTEKDAVKLESIGVKGWFLEVNAKIEETFYSMLIERLQQHAKQKLTGDT